MSPLRMSASLRPVLVPVTCQRFAVRTGLEAKNSLTDASGCILHPSRACKKACWISRLDPKHPKTLNPAQADEPLICNHLATFQLPDHLLTCRIQVWHATAMCAPQHVAHRAGRFREFRDLMELRSTASMVPSIAPWRRRSGPFTPCALLSPTTNKG